MMDLWYENGSTISHENGDFRLWPFKTTESRSLCQEPPIEMITVQSLYGSLYHNSEQVYELGLEPVSNGY